MRRRPTGAGVKSAAISGSGVFRDDAASERARTSLLHKWLALDTPADRMRLLLALQQQYRAARHGAEQEAARQREHADAQAQQQALRELVQAREREIDDARRHAENLDHIVQARDVEIANLNIDITNLKSHLGTLLSERPLKAFVRAWRHRDHDRP